MDSVVVKGVGDFLVAFTLGAATKIWNCTWEIVSTISSFKDDLAQLLNTIESVNSILNDESIKQCRECPFKHTAGRLKNAVEQAEQFADKCSKVAWWNCYKKYKYAKKIAIWNDSLSNLRDKVEEGFEIVKQRRQMDAMNEKLESLILVLGNKYDDILIQQYKSDAKSDAGVLSRIVRFVDSTIEKIKHQLRSIAGRNFSMNGYHKLSFTN